MSNVSAGVLTETVNAEWCPVISYTTNLDRLREELLDMPSARKKFLDLWESSQAAAREVVRPRSPFGRRFRPSPPPDQPPPALETPEYLRYDWRWSAGVLGTLFVLSASILTTRVKSLDRLR